MLISHCRDKGVHFAVCDVWAKGGEGTLELGEEIIKLFKESRKFSVIRKLDRGVNILVLLQQEMDSLNR